MSSLRARLAVLPRGAAVNGQPRWLRRQSCCTKTCWTIQSAAERRCIEPFGELQPSARGRLRAADPWRDRSRSAYCDTCSSWGEACGAHACLPKLRASACGRLRPAALACDFRSVRSRAEGHRTFGRVTALRQGGGCCAIARTRSGRSLQRIRTNGRELRPADGCDVEPSAFMRSSHGQQLAKGRPMRAFAGQSCGPPR